MWAKIPGPPRVVTTPIGRRVRRVAAFLTVTLVFVGACDPEQDVVVGKKTPTTTGNVVTSEAPPQANEEGSESRRRLPCERLASLAPGTVRVELWFADRFWDALKHPRSVVVHRDLPATDGIAAAAVRAWIDGPTKAERRLGAISIANEHTRVRALDISRGTATIDVSSEFHDTGLGTCCEGLVLNGLVGTLTQFPTVDRVELKTDGKPSKYWGGHGGILDPEGEKRSDRQTYRVAKPCSQGR